MRLSVSVVGGGPWGLALAAAASRACTVQIVSRRELAVGLPPSVLHVRDLERVKDTQIVMLAAPSSVARDVARALAPHLDGGHYVVHGVRGLEGDAMNTISDIVRAETAAHRVGAIGGPALADDLLAGRPSVLVCGARFPEVTRAISEAFSSPMLRVYSTKDLKGLEWASALVGCLAILIGAVERLGLGSAIVAALICRSIGEASRLAAEAGGEERTLLGLAGYGDLLASITQHDRPEVVFGRALARGVTKDQALAEATLRVEAVDLIPRVCAWAKARGVRAPIFNALEAGIKAGLSTADLLQRLMTLPIEDGA